MLTIAVIFAIWLLLSVPLSLVLGRSMRTGPGAPELIGMDGEAAVFRLADGREHRVFLTERAPA